YVNDLTIEGSGEKTTAATFDGTVNVNSTLSIANGGSVETKGTSTIAALTGSGTLKASNGTSKVTDASGFTGTLEATGGTLTASGVSSLASMTATGATTLNAKGVTEYDSASGTGGLSLSELVIGAGSTVQAWGTGDTWSQDAEATVLMRGSEDTPVTLTVGTAGQTGTSTLNANLVLDGATVTLNNALTMGSTLTLNNVNLINWDALVAANTSGDPIVLFTSVDSLTLGSGDAAVVAAADTKYDASKAFSNANMSNYKLQMVGTAGDYTVQMVQNAPTPEPTTATLSLLALMGLAARRRRKA
ncbi:MAG: PEP-CTERM sorting domain-containing protein, partial [Akkermansia sp.]